MGEQAVVQAIVETLDLNGAIVTADVLHTKKTIAAIVRQNAHYLLCVKGNQPKLLNGLLKVIEQTSPTEYDKHYEHQDSEFRGS